MGENKVQKTNSEWREQLSPLEYSVLREKATEPAFRGIYTDTKDAGMYRCRGCGAELFRSDDKYDSGSGWPSFTQPAKDGTVRLVDDDSHGMRRVEVVCAACGGHLGHVFPDGPRDRGGTRYCINSCALDLKKDDA